MKATILFFLSLAILACSKEKKAEVKQEAKTEVQSTISAKDSISTDSLILSEDDAKELESKKDELEEALKELGV